MNKRKQLLIAFAAIAAMLCATPSAHADNIDNELLKLSPQLVKALQEKGYKNVGVLKFMVKVGKQSPSANAGPLNLVMATRIENALIHASSDTQPLGVTRDATTVAAKADRKFTTLTSEGRAAIFKHKYPLAWGNELVVPDAFVTGNVELSGDLRHTIVTISAFDKSGAAPHKLLSFTVPTDRSILADSGRSFVLKTRSLRGKTRSADDLDLDATTSASAADSGQTVTQQATGEMPIKFDVQFNGASQVIASDPEGQGQVRIDSPQAGDKVTFVVTNTSPNKIGVVVKVNGESTLSQDTSEDAACQKWILTPGQSCTLRGFYSTEESKVTLFKVLNDDESIARIAEWSGSHPRAGYIDVTVFTETSDGSTDPNLDQQLAKGRMLRGLPHSNSRGLHRPTNHSEARKLIESHGMTTRAHGRHVRGLVVGGDETDAANLKEDQLNNPTSSFHMQINYYKAAL